MNAYIQIIGHVGKNPVLKSYDETGNQKATFSVAVNNYQRKDKDNPPTWFYIESWNGQTERVMNLIKKGREVVITGRLELVSMKSKTDNDQPKEVMLPIIKLNSFHLCGKRPQEEHGEE